MISYATNNYYHLKTVNSLLLEAPNLSISISNEIQGFQKCNINIIKTLLKNNKFYKQKIPLPFLFYFFFVTYHNSKKQI